MGSPRERILLRETDAQDNWLIKGCSLPRLVTQHSISLPLSHLRARAHTPLAPPSRISEGDWNLTKVSRERRRRRLDGVGQ